MTGEQAPNPADQPADHAVDRADSRTASPGDAGSASYRNPDHPVAQVVLRFAPLPEHVRTARLVAVAMARRVGVEDGLLDEVRLAVGEACSRAVGLHRGVAPRAPIEVRLTEGRERFGVEVLDVVSGGPVPKPDESDESRAHRAAGPVTGGEDSLADDAGAQMGLAVLRGLVDDLEVRLTGQGGVIRMGWAVAGPHWTG